jgi:hypothetical protein
MWQSGSQLLLGHHGETVDSRIDQKAFEPGHSGGGKSCDVVLIIVDSRITDYASPSPPIDAASAFCGCALGLERSDRRGCRKAVQGHVDQ